MSTEIIIFIVCLAIVVSFVVWLVLNKDEKWDPDMVAEYHTWLYKGQRCKVGVLEIIDDSKTNELIFRICAGHHIDTKYIPEEYHYGSVTVGGVTTGGVYKTGGKTIYYDRGKNGKYSLEYYYLNKISGVPTLSTREVSYIKLTPEMLISAKKSEIAKYLDDEYIDAFNRSKENLELIVKWLRNYKKTPS